MTEMIYTGENIGHRIISKYFQITIDNPKVYIETDEINDEQNKNVSYFVSNRGFVDGFKFTEYKDFNNDDEETETNTLNTYIDKAAGYVRWNKMCLDLSRFGVFFMEIDRLEDANSKTEPSSITFTFGYEQPESIIEFVNDDYIGEYETLRDGRKIIKGVDALKEIIAKTLCSDIMLFSTVYDPTTSTFAKNGLARGDAKVSKGFYDKMIKAIKVFDDKEVAKSKITIKEMISPDGSKIVEM